MSKKKTDNQEKQHAQLQERIKPKTKGQQDYLRTLIENDVTFVTGDAGTGKSYLALGLAAEYLSERRYDKIIIARPAIEASKRGIGYLPGDINTKLEPYVLPSIQHLKRFFGKDTYANMIRDEAIKYVSLEYMRGSTYDYSFMILEEAQNCTTEQLIMFITRIGINSKILINGDINQTDLRNEGESSDLFYVIEKVKRANLKSFGIAELTENDIVRSPLIADFLRAMK